MTLAKKNGNKCARGILPTKQPILTYKKTLYNPPTTILDGYISTPKNT